MKQNKPSVEIQAVRKIKDVLEKETRKKYLLVTKDDCYLLAIEIVKMLRDKKLLRDDR